MDEFQLTQGGIMLKFFQLLGGLIVVAALVVLPSVAKRR